MPQKKLAEKLIATYLRFWFFHWSGDFDSKFKISYDISLLSSLYNSFIYDGRPKIEMWKKKIYFP
jgi:hypothetical protein